VILPKLISIDTSVFGVIAKDYYSQNKKKSEKAHQVISHLNNEGYVPFLSFHHIREILQHQDDEVVFNRWSLIKKFPTVAWICSSVDENVLGSIVDLHELEVRLLLENKSDHLEKFANLVKSKYIKYSSGEEFIEHFELLYCQVRELGMIDIQRGKEIESLSHVRSKDVDNTRLSELFDSKLRTPEETKEFMKQFESDLVESLTREGDEKLSDPQDVAKSFVNEVLDEGEKLYSSNLTLYESFVKSAGVRLDQVTPKTTVGELGYLGVYNQKVKQILESLGVPEEREVELSPSEQISWIIWKHMDKAMKSGKRASGSNMEDRHMGILALFTDIFTADKRVHEYFRRLSRSEPSIYARMGEVVKLSKYSDLVAICS